MQTFGVFPEKKTPRADPNQCPLFYNSSFTKITIISLANGTLYRLLYALTTHLSLFSSILFYSSTFKNGFRHSFRKIAKFPNSTIRLYWLNKWLVFNYNTRLNLKLFFDSQRFIHWFKLVSLLHIYIYLQTN